MATVFFSRSLQPYTGGTERVAIQASNVRELIRALDARFPGLGARLEAGLAIAIDGEIIPEPLLEAVGPESEIHFLPPIGGG